MRDALNPIQGENDFTKSSGEGKKRESDGKSRTALITGGSRGIGAAMVRRFTAAGDRVFFTWHSQKDAAEALARETGAEAIRADVRDGEAVRAAVGHVLQAAGQLDVLICNAGTGGSRGLLADTTDEEYRRIMDTNVYGVFAAVRAALPSMFWRRRGCVLTVSSIWGETGGSCEAVYSASKAAVIGLTRALAKETAGAGIRVNCIAPGMIDTSMNDHLSGEDKAALAEEIPLGRIGTPEEVAETAFFLAGEGASYLTGQVIGVNGGWRI